MGSNVTVYIKGLVFSYPVRCAGSKWSIVQGGLAVIISGQRCDDSMQGLVFSYPVRCAGGKWNIVQYLDSIRPGVL